jgi:hypothetical protein
VGTAPPTLRRDLLVRAVAYRIQEQAFGGLSAATKRRLRQIASEVRERGDVAVTSGLRMKPGTRLVREWRGDVHEVSALEEGFSYRGERYRRLSEIARRITGSRWNGHLFFGLKRRTECKEPARRKGRGGGTV